MDNSTSPQKSLSARWQFQPLLIVLLLAHIVATCISLSYVTAEFPGIFVFDTSGIAGAIFDVSCFALIGAVFTVARFSFGYVAGFYFYTMILGYLWLVRFSVLSYNHPLAIASIFLSALAFLAPALFTAFPIRPRIELSPRRFDLLLSLILVLAAAIVAIGALYNFKFVGISEMYKFREEIDMPTPLRYAIGVTSNALLPFAFAGFVACKQPLRAGIALLLIGLLYPVTLTKLTLFAPFWLLFLAVLGRFLEARTAVVLSMFLPLSAGIAALALQKAGLMSYGLEHTYFGVVNSRMLGMPSIALEVYNNFFASHDLTHFCQINVLKPFMSCPYQEPLAILMLKAYDLGAFNASLFATEGIASVGLLWAPVSAFVCGLMIALANYASGGISPKFILLSGGVLLQVLLNVPLSITLVTYGAAVLFVLWYLTPRTLFE